MIYGGGLQIQGFAVLVGDEGVIAAIGEQGKLRAGGGLDPPHDETYRHGVGLALEGSAFGLGHVGATLHPVGEGINAEAAWLSWPMWTLDKISFIGNIILVCGIVVLVVAGPRRREVLFSRGWGRRRMLGLSMIWLNIVAWALFAFAAISATLLVSSLLVALEIAQFVTREFTDFDEDLYWIFQLPLYCGALGFTLFIGGARRPGFSILNFQFDPRAYIPTFARALANLMKALVVAVPLLISGKFDDAYDEISYEVSIVGPLLLVISGLSIAIGGVIWGLFQFLGGLIGIGDGAGMGPVCVIALGVFMLGLVITPVEYK